MCFTEWMAILFIRFIIEIKGNATLFFLFQLPFFLPPSALLPPFQTYPSRCVCIYLCCSNPSSVSRNFVFFCSCTFAIANSVFITPIFCAFYKRTQTKQHFQINIVVILAFGIPYCILWWLFFLKNPNQPTRKYYFIFWLMPLYHNQRFFFPPVEMENIVKMWRHTKNQLFIGILLCQKFIVHFFFYL